MAGDGEVDKENQPPPPPFGRVLPAYAERSLSASAGPVDLPMAIINGAGRLLI
ncbi:MAG: hypothetical protein GH151_08425 [Bacteroidetes bacterium]|nr:hypothetical protein [Bacteroidota bacterium]